MSLENLKKRWEINSKQPLLKVLKCPLCNYDSSIEYFKKITDNDIFYAGELIRYLCPNCDVVFGDMRFLTLSLEEIGNDYTDLYSFYSESDTTNNILKCFEVLNLDHNLKGLDYACGKWNNHIEILNHQGYNIIGFDKYVKKNSPYYLNNIEDQKFDYIISNNFIEHVINPITDLQNILNFINTNGLLILITACFEYCYGFSHFHTFFFLGRSIKVLEEKLNITLINNYELQLGGEKVIIKVFKKN